jgi:ribosomal protein S18 acetylase RimI-like enzyme
VADGLSAAISGVELRPATPGDREFLVAVFRTTREDELDRTGWSEPEKAAFVDAQFRAQDVHYRETYPDGRFLVVTRAGEPIGRLSLAQRADEVRVMDIALVPGARGQGIGSSLLAAVMTEADAAGLPVRLHVEPWNPAKRLYERLGFRTLEVRGFYELMERPPAVEGARAGGAAVS